MFKKKIEIKQNMCWPTGIEFTTTLTLSYLPQHTSVFATSVLGTKTTINCVELYYCTVLAINTRL